MSPAVASGDSGLDLSHRAPPHDDESRSVEGDNVSDEDATQDVVLYEADGGVATLTLNRPGSANGWTGPLEKRYFELLAQCQADSAIKAIVVTGAGRTFCPGADMNNLQAYSKAGPSAATGNVVEARTGYPLHYPTTITKPTIAAINGACAGVGLVQALMLDVRFSAPGVKYTVAFARRGLVAEYGSAWLLPRLVGHSRALDLLMSSRVVLAEEALTMGLISQIHPAERLLDEARSYAFDLATNCSPTSMAVMKRQVNDAWHQSLPEAMDEAFELMNKSLKRADFKEGVSSYLEKRSPHFDPITGDL